MARTLALLATVVALTVGASGVQAGAQLGHSASLTSTTLAQG